MFRLPRITVLVFSLFATLAAYSQADMPVEILQKLDNKAKELYPDKAREQQSWIDSQVAAWQTIPLYKPTKGNEVYFAEIIKMADEKYPLDFKAKLDFIMNMSIGLEMIDAFASAYPDKAEFLKLKENVILKHPADYGAAAKEFEKLSIAVMEIKMLPIPEGLNKDVYEAIKLGLALKFKNDFERQKTELTALYDRFQALALHEQIQKSLEQNQGEVTVSMSEKMNEAKKYLSSAALLIQGDTAMGFLINIRGKDAIIFPSDAYDARSISITNKYDERIGFEDVYASKDVPLVIAFVKSLPNGIQKIEIAKETELRENIGNEVFMFSTELRNENISRTRIVSIGEYVNISTKISNATKLGSIIVNPDDKKALSIVVNKRNFSDIGNFGNSADVKHVIREISGVNPVKAAVRIDKLENWERLDNQTYTNQSEALEQFKKHNLEYLNFFTATSFSSLQGYEVFRDIYSKFSDEGKSKYDKPSQEKLVRDIIGSLIQSMRKELQRTNTDNVLSVLKDDYEYAILVRKKMMEYLDNCIKNRSYMNYYFNDLKPNSR